MKLQATGQSSERARLSHVLERLAEESPALARTRHRRAGDGEAQLIMVLREIDETVLARRIVLVSGTREIASLWVSNRRLVHLDIPGEAAGGGAEPGDAQNAARHHALRLQAVLEGARQVQMRIDRAAPSDAPSSFSCSARSLAVAIGLSLTPANGTGDLRDVLRMIESETLAWLYTGARGGEDRQHGDAALVAGLKAFRDREQKVAPNSIRAARPTCLLLPLPNGRALATASAGGDQLLAVVRKSALPGVLSAWENTFAETPA